MGKNAFWILVTHDIKEEFKNKDIKNQWPIYSHTHHKKCLAKGDKVIFYLAGEHGKKFIGKAEIDSPLQKRNDCFDYHILLKNIEYWKKPVMIKTLLESLEFIKIKSKWGLYLQSGVCPITEKDYSLIIS